MNRSRLASVVLGCAVGAIAATSAGSASAVPPVGAPRPELSFTDGWERKNDLARYRGVPILVLYEDKDSATVNRPLKEDLARLASGDRYRDLIALLPFADLTSYDYWPVRGFVKDAIQDESKKQKTVIYCDWDGHVRRGLKLQKGTSNVVLFGRDGRVSFSHAGALSPAQRNELIELLRREVANR